MLCTMYTVYTVSAHSILASLYSVPDIPGTIAWEILIYSFMLNHLMTQLFCKFPDHLYKPSCIAHEFAYACVLK